MLGARDGSRASGPLTYARSTIARVLPIRRIHYYVVRLISHRCDHISRSVVRGTESFPRWFFSSLFSPRVRLAAPRRWSRTRSSTLARDYAPTGRNSGNEQKNSSRPTIFHYLARNLRTRERLHAGFLMTRR